jgi:hypothetical protein
MARIAAAAWAALAAARGGPAAARALVGEEGGDLALKGVGLAGGAPLAQGFVECRDTQAGV